MNIDLRYLRCNRSATQHEIVSWSCVINRNCQAVTCSIWSFQSESPYCHGWRGQPGGRGLWDEVLTYARVNQSGVRHTEKSSTNLHSGFVNQKWSSGQSAHTNILANGDVKIPSHLVDKQVSMNPAGIKWCGAVVPEARRRSSRGGKML